MISFLLILYFTSVLVFADDVVQIRYAKNYQETDISKTYLQYETLSNIIRNTSASPPLPTTELSAEEEPVHIRTTSLFHPVSDWTVGIISVIFLVVMMALLAMSVTEPHPSHGHTISAGPNELPKGLIGQFMMTPDTYAIDIVEKGDRRVRFHDSVRSIEALVTDVIKV